MRYDCRSAEAARPLFIYLMGGLIIAILGPGGKCLIGKVGKLWIKHSDSSKISSVNRCMISDRFFYNLFGVNGKFCQI